jgi:hypothetical protein
VKRLTKPNHGKQFTLAISRGADGQGVHQLKAVVRFVPAAKAAAVTRRLTFQQCPHKVAPAFTGDRSLPQS